MPLPNRYGGFLPPYIGNFLSIKHSLPHAPTLQEHHDFICTGTKAVFGPIQHKHFLGVESYLLWFDVQKMLLHSFLYALCNKTHPEGLNAAARIRSSCSFFFTVSFFIDTENPPPCFCWLVFHEPTLLFRTFHYS